MIKNFVIFLCIIFCSSVLVYADNITDNYDLVYTPEYKEVKCEICGKILYEYDDYITLTNGTAPYNFFDKSAYHFTGGIVVCEGCYNKYIDEFDIYIKNFVSDKRKENTKLIKENEENEKKDKIIEKLNELEKLYGELRELYDGSIILKIPGGGNIYMYEDEVWK